jgi:hypothetical protein
LSLFTELFTKKVDSLKGVRWSSELVYRTFFVTLMWPFPTTME